MSAAEELLMKLLLPARLLYLNGDKRQADALLQQIQARYECVVDWVASGEEAKHKLDQHKYDLLLFQAGPQSGPVLRHAKAVAPSTPVVLVGEHTVDELLLCGPVTLIKRPPHQNDIDDLFQVFKVRVRTREDAQYFALCSSPVAA